MSSTDDSEPRAKKALTTEEVALVPPPPSNVQVPGTAVNIAFMQDPHALASLPSDLQRRVFDGIDKDNERQFDLSKMALEAQERARRDTLAERQQVRQQALEERHRVRMTLLVSVGGAGLIGVGIYVFLLVTGRDDAAKWFFDNFLKIAGGALGGSGVTALYKSNAPTK